MKAYCRQGEPKKIVGLIEKTLREDFPHGHPDFIPITLDEVKLHSAKNKDYTGGNSDPLGNFRRVSEALKLWGYRLKPYDVAWIYMMKQVDAVGRMFAQEYEGEIEGIDDKLQDISVYAKLARILYKEGQKQ